MSTPTILYSYYRSSTSYRARIALNWKQIPYEQINVHLLEDGGQQHKPAYRAVNPTGEVPSLNYQGKIISQSVAILEFLEEIHPENPIFPKDPFERAKVRQFCENINSGIHPLTNLKVTQYLSKTLSHSAAEVEAWQLNWLGQGLSATEKILEQFSKTYAFGDQVTAADLCLIPQVFSALRFKFNLEPFPLIRKVNENCLKLEAFKKAHPHCQPDTPPELKNQF